MVVFIYNSSIIGKDRIGMGENRMEKRTFEKLGVATSLLGFGCMRFPTTSEGKIDRVASREMLEVAYQSGVNYYDTARPYHNGESEEFVGEFLDTKPRDSYYLATKLPVWEINSLEDAKNMFEKQLSYLHKEYIDFYLMHAFDQGRFEKMKALGIFEYFEELKGQGKIRFLGFSFHDDYNAFEKIITDREWDFCQIQYNYMDVEDQAGEKGYLLAEKLQIPLIIMEPIKGGSLAYLPEDIKGLLPNQEQSPASYALRFVASKSNVKVVLSGMSDIQQVQENIGVFNPFVCLDVEEEQAILKVRTSINDRVKNGCTACNYCMPCPAGVDIPGNFKIWNNYHMYQNQGELKWQWNNLKNDKKTADFCVECGICETKCPQKIQIRKDLKTLKTEFHQILDV